MALKPDRDEMHFDIRWYCNTACDSGGIASVVSGGTGGYPGHKNAVVAYAANPTGAKPIGVLLESVVDLNTNRQHENWEKFGFEAQKGSKVTLIKDGFVTTNMLVASLTPAAGDPAYLGASGLITNTFTSGVPKIGQFLSAKDSDGYASVRINIV